MCVCEWQIDISSDAENPEEDNLLSARKVELEHDGAAVVSQTMKLDRDPLFMFRPTSGVVSVMGSDNHGHS